MKLNELLLAGYKITMTDLYSQEVDLVWYDLTLQKETESGREIEISGRIDLFNPQEILLESTFGIKLIGEDEWTILKIEAFPEAEKIADYLTDQNY